MAQLAPKSARKAVNISTMPMDRRSVVVVTGCLCRFSYLSFFYRQIDIVSFFNSFLQFFYRPSDAKTHTGRSFSHTTGSRVCHSRNPV